MKWQNWKQNTGAYAMVQIKYAKKGIQDQTVKTENKDVLHSFDYHYNLCPARPVASAIASECITLTV